MYLYFDVNGNLKEMVQIPVREGSELVNTIYIYVESGATEPQNKTYHLPTFYTNAKINFELLNGDTNLNPEGSYAMEKVTIDGIPFNNNRDLYFFKYGYKYEMWSFTLVSPVTAVTGIVSATAYLFKDLDDDDEYDNNEPQLPLNTFNFNVEASVGIKIDSTLTQSQYSYLYNIIKGFNINNYVPYTGAVKNVNLGNHGLDLNSLTFVYDEKVAVVSYVSGSHDLKIEFGDRDEDLGTLIIPSVQSGVQQLATIEWAINNIKPSKSVIGTFNTGDFAQPSGETYYQLDDIALSGTLGDLLIITWGNAFAICPVPSQTDTKGEDIMYGSEGDTVMEEQRYITTHYTLNGIYTAAQVWQQASCTVYLYAEGGGSDYTATIYGEVEVTGVVDDKTVVEVTYDLGNTAENLCPNWNGTFDIDGESVYRLIKVREGHIAAAMIASSGYSQIVRMKYVITDDTKLSITTDSSFTPPANYTGYVINYKIV